MVNLFGSVKRIIDFGGKVFLERIYENPRYPKYKEKFAVNTPTTLLVALDFENGVVGTFHISSNNMSSNAFRVASTDSR